jgi:hypothetical protein
LCIADHLSGINGDETGGKSDKPDKPNPWHRPFDAGGQQIRGDERPHLHGHGCGPP